MRRVELAGFLSFVGTSEMEPSGWLLVGFLGGALGFLVGRGGEGLSPFLVWGLGTFIAGAGRIISELSGDELIWPTAVVMGACYYLGLIVGESGFFRSTRR